MKEWSLHSGSKRYSYLKIAVNPLCTIMLDIMVFKHQYNWLPSHLLGFSEQNFLKNESPHYIHIACCFRTYTWNLLLQLIPFNVDQLKNTYCIPAWFREMQAIWRLHNSFLCYQFWYTEHFNFSFGISGAAVQNTNSCFIISIYFLISDHFPTLTQHIFINRIWVWKDKKWAH